MKRLNDRITAYGFVLTVFVIWLHAGESLISIIPGQIAVPGFFMMSGFLFFRGFDGEASCKEVFKRKLKTRVSTLLVPYLLWNLIYFLIYYAFGKATLKELPLAILHYGYNPVFWYLFQLILITVLTPLIYVCMKKKAGAICWLTVIFVLAVFYTMLPIHYCNEDALFYYSLGAYCSLQKVDICKKSYVRLPSLAALFVITWFLQYVLPAPVANVSAIGWRASGSMLLWVLINYVSEIKGLREFEILPWMKINFFVYATHYLVIRGVWALEETLGLNTSVAANVITYLIMPVVCIAVAYGIYIFMKRFIPHALLALTGGR